MAYFFNNICYSSPESRRSLCLYDVWGKSNTQLLFQVQKLFAQYFPQNSDSDCFLKLESYLESI